MSESGLPSPVTIHHRFHATACRPWWLQCGNRSTSDVRDLYRRSTILAVDKTADGGSNRLSRMHTGHRILSNCLFQTSRPHTLAQSSSRGDQRRSGITAGVHTQPDDRTAQRCYAKARHVARPASPLARVLSPLSRATRQHSYRSTTGAPIEASRRPSRRCRMFLIWHIIDADHEILVDFHDWMKSPSSLVERPHVGLWHWLLDGRLSLPVNSSRKPARAQTQGASRAN